MKITKQDLRLVLEESLEDNNTISNEIVDEFWKRLKKISKESKKSKILKDLIKNSENLKRRLSKGEKIFGYFTDSPDFAIKALSHKDINTSQNFGELTMIKDGKFCQSSNMIGPNSNKLWTYFIEVDFINFKK